MGIIARNERQLTLIYSSNTRKGTNTLSYLTAINDRYLAIDIAKTKITGTQWAEISDTLGVKIGDLVDTRELDFKGEEASNFTSEDWIKIIQNNDFVISKPIAIKGNKTMQINDPTEILEFFEVDSAGLEQRPSEAKDLDIERTTGDEKFIEKNK